MVYEAVIKVDIYGVGLANTRAQLIFSQKPKIPKMTIQYPISQ
jgi:hypothetical protein